MDVEDVEELLFFDTFAHDASEEINLDLVQFPKPVIISQIRVIPLGARVQADFPGGVRLGATNPSQFHIEFFVNDLSKHGAAAFESLGALDYRQTSDIHAEFDQKIPTDGLVLRGWYTTITLAVYGSLSKGLPAPLPDPRPGELSASAATAEWVQSQQAAIYRDPSYSYPPDFPPTPAEHSYVEAWPSTAPPATVMPHSDPYDPSMTANWEPPPTEELKPWVPKEDYLKGQSPLKSNGGDASKARSRSDYWDEREERRRTDPEPKRYDACTGKDEERRRDRDRTPERSWRSFETRTRPKTHRESSWDRDRDRSPYSEDNYRRRPKSPSSRSPKRPITPTDRFWSPERRDYRSPPVPRHRAASPPRNARPSEHLRVDITGSPQTPLQSPLPPPPRPDDRNPDEEEFEPILSDEDIVDESDSQYPDGDYDAPDDLEDVVKPFSPFSFQVQPLQNIPDPSKTLFELLPDGDVAESLETVKKLMAGVNLEAHEDWITAVEQLPSHLPRALKYPADDNLKNELIKWVWHGLSLDVALGHQLPGAKLRHIKGGIRLAGALCHCEMAQVLVQESGLQERLLRLFHREHMALSIRLLILEALDATLLDSKAFNHLITHEWELEIDGASELATTYQHLLRMIDGKQQVRIKFALASLIQKFHLVESLEQLEIFRNMIVDGKTDLPANDFTLNLQTIQRNFVHAGTLLSQPKRFLPVQAQFEIKIDPKPVYLFLYKYFQKHKLLETLLVIMSGRSTCQAVQAAAYDLLKEMLKSRHGVAFLAANSVTTSALIKTIQAVEDVVETSGGEGFLTLELPLRLNILWNLDKLASSSQEESEIFNVLHDLFCMTFSPLGKAQIANILAQEDSMDILLKHVDSFGQKSVVRSYIIDLAELAVRYSDDLGFLRHVGKTLVELAECDNASKLLDPLRLIRPVEGLPDDVAVLVEILKKHAVADFSGTYHWELITAIRLLRSLCLPSRVQLSDSQENEEAPYFELRFKHSLLQLYSLDGLADITTLLTKMLQYYEQPFMHSSCFVGSQGHNIVSFIESAIVIVRRMLTYLIEARGSEYKDLTHVSVLIDVYALMKAVPVAAESYGQAQNVSRHIVKTLLAYTDPLAQTDTYAKSLWTLMLSDVLKFILKAPYCFLPGFLLLSELLPLPLPLPCKTPLSDDEVNELKAARQLWSAHIHPLAGPLHDLLATLANASYPPLLQLMRRVGVQLADVAAPTALVVARAILDPLLATLARTDGGWEMPVPVSAARLLHFLSFTITHPSVKAAVLSLVTAGANARTDERLLTLVDGFTHILKSPGSTPAHIQAQECVLLIFQALLDADNTLVPCSGNASGLANALPAREVIATVIVALLDHVSVSEHPMPCLLLALKALILLTDNDFGFYRLKIGLDTRRDALFNVLSRLSNELSREHTGALNALHFTLALLREFVLDAPTPMRTLTMTPDELGRALKWGEKEHPLLKIHECLKEWSVTGESLNNLCDSAGDLVKLLGKSDPDAVSSICKDEEPTLPQAMPLMKQFSSSPVFIVREPDIKTLSSSYWSTLPVADEADLESEQVQCDLIELCNNFLPDLNLSNEIPRVCRLKSSPEEEKKTETTKFPLAGARIRRPFVAPMRGRGGRPTQQRGDLFRSRPPNTSRPPSLHVDDFVALETCGQQPTGPTGYNKVSVRNVKEVIGNRVRGRGRAFASPYPRRESPRPVARGRPAWSHEELRAPPTSRFRAWQTEDVRRIHPFPR